MLLVTYGLGHNLDLTKFKPIKNRQFVKPSGGLWASPVDSEYGWKEWCQENNYGNLSTSFEFEIEGNVLVIDNLKDLKQLPFVTVYDHLKFPDFEKIANSGYDAIWLTLNGECETRHSDPSLYGWDCECVLVLNEKVINANS